MMVEIRAVAFAMILALVAAGPAPGQPSAPQGAHASPDRSESDDSSQGREETITVTATRLPVDLSDMPHPVTVLSSERLRQLPALVLDDALRWVPSVGLFRRTSSLFAHPTAQGLNLRGLAPSGVSRALVLVDGVPLNDPFGGWVYWDRVPMLAIDRVAVAPGGGSAPWGNYALGGAVQLTTRRARRSGFEIQALAGDHATTRFGLAAGTSTDSLALLATAEVFHTAGYVATAPAERGAVDSEVASTHQSARIRFDLPWQLSLVADGLRERRQNGTPLQRNNTTAGGVTASWRSDLGSGGVELRAFARSQRFDSFFSSVADDRDSERLVLEQRVPSTDVGASGFVWRPLGSTATLSVGGDWRRVAGHSKETVIFTGAGRAPGGVQNLGGGFAALDWAAGDRLSLTLAARVDGWSQRPVETAGEPFSKATLSPRIGAVVDVGRGATLRGSAYRAFRAPTLNELYRQFRVGNVLTLPNAALDEETLRGFELGGGWTGALGDGSGVPVEIRATFYWNDLENGVINATEQIGPRLIRRRRRNLGSSVSRGVELDGRVTPIDGLSLSASLAWLDSTIADDPVLDGNRLPQVPEYRARGTALYRAAGGWTALLSVGATGVQFEDDTNLLPLAPAMTVAAAAEVPLVSTIALTLRGENLLDAEVAEKRTPALTLGPPRTIYAGFTLSFPTGEGVGR